MTSIRKRGNRGDGSGERTGEAKREREARGAGEVEGVVGRALEGIVQSIIVRMIIINSF